MESKQYKPLTVYKASAGSGKTFTLAVEYIKLLINNPNCFKNILAVTFTNKATEEMKERILSQLYGIWKMLPDSDGYMEKITEELGVTKQFASRQAGVALQNILHNYSYFRVETIDSFFQRVLRNLSRELDMVNNMSVSINDKTIESLAVDQLIQELNEDSELLKWIVKFIFNNIEENKGWNIFKKIQQFGENIFKDSYRRESVSLSNTLQQSNFLEQYISKIINLRDDSLNKIKARGDEFFNIIKENNLPESSFNRNIVSYFNKLREGNLDKDVRNATVEKCLIDGKSWTTQKSPHRDEIKTLAQNRLIAFLDETEDIRMRNEKNYFSAQVTLRQLHFLNLLNAIEKKVREINDETNTFLLSDTQQLLNELIGEHDSPFVFEKIGTRLEHIMIDEFQDTSTIQWRNFKVLLDECLSNCEPSKEPVQNLIVGDVKQSIYRWRSGDWQLLNDINTMFRDSQLNIETLATNYRSEGNVVRFNNAFFLEAMKREVQAESSINTVGAKKIAKAYSDVSQNIPDKKQSKGMVQVKVLAEKSDVDDMIKEVESCVDMLLDAGVSQNNIAILLRNNDNIALIADYFLKNRSDIKIVSDDAFLLSSSDTVDIIISAMRLIVHPEDNILRSSLAIKWNRVVKGIELDNKCLIVDDNYTERINSTLPPLFIDKFSMLQEMPIYDLAEYIYSVFKLNKLCGQDSYICLFFDVLLEFTNNGFSDINSFLDEYDTNLYKKSIQADSSDGIRMITIHKSKGLEFANVIVPFCDWKMDSINTLWLTPNKAPFSDIPLVPIVSSKTLLKTIYKDSYIDEHMQSTVDNLNLLYVAFTRASENLFVFGRQGSVNFRTKIIVDSIADLCKNPEEHNLEASLLSYCMDETSKKSEVFFQYGELYIGKTERKETNNIFLREPELINLNIETYNKPLDFRQSNKSKDFINTPNSCEESTGNFIEMGNILHNVLAHIESYNDIDKALKGLEFEGILPSKDFSSDKIKDILMKRFEMEPVKDWFSGKWKTFNERTILCLDEQGNAKAYRPDRVMTDGTQTVVVDFKLAKHNAEYVEQVKNYILRLKDMGYRNVTGYVWYVLTNSILPVDIDNCG